MTKERGGLVAGNWKDVNMTVKRSLDWGSDFGSLVTKTTLNPALQLILFPPFLVTYPLKQRLFESEATKKMMDDDYLALGAQDISPVEGEKTRVTGSHHPNLLKEVGMNHVLLGHSERRMHLGESDELIGRKLLMAIKYGITSILCVGETIEEYTAKKTKDVIRTQLSVLNPLSTDERKRMSVAYEPVWAIGTGKTPKADEANDVCGFIRKESGAGNVIYGGSVTPENAAEFFSKSEIDGGLPGGASENADKFFGIAQAASNLL